MSTPFVLGRGGGVGWGRGRGHRDYTPWSVIPNQASVLHGQSEITVCQVQSDVRICHVPSDTTICHGESEIILTEIKRALTGCHSVVKGVRCVHFPFPG